MEDPGSQDLILQFVLLFVLTLLNAFFLCNGDVDGIAEPFSRRAKG